MIKFYLSLTFSLELYYFYFYLMGGGFNHWQNDKNDKKMTKITKKWQKLQNYHKNNSKQYIKLKIL